MYRPLRFGAAAGQTQNCESLLTLMSPPRAMPTAPLVNGRSLSSLLVAAAGPEPRVATPPAAGPCDGRHSSAKIGW